MLILADLQVVVMNPVDVKKHGDHLWIIGIPLGPFATRLACAVWCARTQRKAVPDLRKEAVDAVEARLVEERCEVIDIIVAEIGQVADHFLRLTLDTAQHVSPQVLPWPNRPPLRDGLCDEDPAGRLEREAIGHRRIEHHDFLSHLTHRLFPFGRSSLSC